jgi:hypothetical protein
MFDIDSPRSDRTQESADNQMERILSLKPGLRQGLGA